MRESLLSLMTLGLRWVSQQHWRLLVMRQYRQVSSKNAELTTIVWTDEIGDAYFGSNHPMKPHRLCMTHHLVIAYGLHKDLQVFVRPLSS